MIALALIEGLIDKLSLSLTQLIHIEKTSSSSSSPEHIVHGLFEYFIALYPNRLSQTSQPCLVPNCICRSATFETRHQSCFEHAIRFDTWELNLCNHQSFKTSRHLPSQLLGSLWLKVVSLDMTPKIRLRVGAQPPENAATTAAATPAPPTPAPTKDRASETELLIMKDVLKILYEHKDEE